ncbi:MAG: ThiF family adenylyltransferase [Acidimicrobiales bacterium]
MSAGWSLLIPPDLMGSLTTHLFPGDGDEHGAVLVAGMAETSRGVRLLARDAVLARDGIDYVPGKHGYRMLTASFVTDNILRCATDRLVYLAVHCHGHGDSVSFSGDDLASHERGYPALLDIADGLPVGAVVFASDAVAGDIWLPDGRRVELEVARVVGRPQRVLHPKAPRRILVDPTYDRQARLFGDRGQAILADQKVGVIGAGGAGSLIVEYLARLGVGHLVVVDPDRIERSNLPRVVGSTQRDALAWLTSPARHPRIRRVGERFSLHKTSIATRVARQANPSAVIERIADDIAVDAVAQRFTDCDFLFLAADTMRARLVFNALVQQYLIPGAQVGAKVTVDKSSGGVLDVFSVYRPVLPGSGCLWCNDLISPARLQEEALSETERRQQRYVEEATVHAPSVITLNAVACAHAVDDYLFSVTCLLAAGTTNAYRRFLPREADFMLDQPRRDPECTECGCGPKGRLGMGSALRLPTR